MKAKNESSTPAATGKAQKLNTTEKVENATAMESLEVRKLTPRKVLAQYMLTHAESIAKKCISAADTKNAVTFEEAKDRTHDFSRIFTTAEPDGERVHAYKVINGKAFAYKENEDLSADGILASYESLAMILEAQRIEDARTAKAAEKAEKIEELATAFGLPVEIAESLYKAGKLKI